MYTDIFSSFDPATSAVSSMSNTLFFASAALSAILVKNEFWMAQTQKAWLINSASNVMIEQTSRTTADHIKGTTSLLTPLFITLIMINLIGLLPYSFSLSSHILFSFSFGLPIWFMIILSASIHNPTSYMAHLLPAGAPLWLNPFLVIVETLSNLVRPITLSFRLAANMSAGHVMLTLASTFLMSAMVTLNPYSTLSLLFICSFYSIFEMAICLIQAYIFCLLLSLYTDDHPMSTESSQQIDFGSIDLYYMICIVVVYNKTLICGVSELNEPQ